MEKRFQSLSLFDFQAMFPDTDKCMAYLADIKWGGGYSCKNVSMTSTVMEMGHMIGSVPCADM